MDVDKVFIVMFEQVEVGVVEAFKDAKKVKTESASFVIKEGMCLVLIVKVVKNEVEMVGMVEVYFMDGVVMVEFWCVIE